MCSQIVGPLGNVTKKIFSQYIPSKRGYAKKSLIKKYWVFWNVECIIILFRILDEFEAYLCCVKMNKKNGYKCRKQGMNAEKKGMNAEKKGMFSKKLYF